MMKPLEQYEVRYTDAKEIYLGISLNVIENELVKEYSVLFTYDSMVACNKFWNQDEEFIKSLYTNLDQIYNNDFLRSKLQVPIKLSRYINTNDIINNDPLFVLDDCNYLLERNGHGYINRIYCRDEVTNDLLLNTGVEYSDKTIIYYNEDFKEEAYGLLELDGKRVVRKEYVLDRAKYSEQLFDYDDKLHECKIYEGLKAGQVKCDDKWRELYSITYKTGHSFDDNYISCINKRIYIDKNRYIELTKTNKQY